MQVVNPQLRAERTAAPAVRTVTVLGATGSVGMSTVDLLKRGNGKYRVEAVTANKNAAELAKIARDLNARVAVVADPSAYGELKDALSGTGIQAASGEAAVIEAAERPADWVMAAVSGAVGLKPTLAAVKRGATVALANKECLVCAGGMFMRTAAASRHERAAGRFRAQRHLPGADRGPARGRQPHRHHRVRRSVPHLDARGDARRPSSSRRSSIRTGRWVRRSPSIPRPCSTRSWN